MAKLISIEEADLAKIGEDVKYCEELEAGNILFLAKCPFQFPKADLDFLLAQRQAASKHRKNIAYKPQTDRITNFVHSSPQQMDKMHGIMKGYSEKVVQFLSQLLPPYANQWRLDYASFRPFQEETRELRVRARNDLLHTDAFPTRPMHGNRILRFFTNINPHESRQWITSESFQELAKRHGGPHGVPFPESVSDGFGDRLASSIKQFAKKLGLPVVLRSPYDSFMMEMHNYLKENQQFQENCPKDCWDFPPNCCWIVFSDQVSHAVKAGQYALEQTIIVPQQALVHPEMSPLGVLERLASRSMINPHFAPR
jgi:hypothetical protein